MHAPPFMWEEGARIYGTPGVHNNFPYDYMLYRSHFNSCAVRINEKFIWRRRKKLKKTNKQTTTTKKVHMPTSLVYTSLGLTILLSFFISLT